jgi:uncharacterized protein with WD repeat
MAERRFALIVASNHYQDAALQQLLAPAQDAEALARVLQNPAIGDFEVKTLLDKPCHEVRQEIEAFFDDRRRDDLLALYFSCHGIKDANGQLYFATCDTNRKRPRSTAVPAKEVNEMMASCRSRRQVLLLDCCYGGAVTRGMLTKSDPAVHTKERFEGTGRVVLTASDEMQYSFEDDVVSGKGTLSVFTRHLVEGLETGEADLDGDGEVSLDELYEYIHDRVTADRPEQRPQRCLDAAGKIIFAKSQLVLRPAELRPELQHLVESPISEHRIEAVRQLELLFQGTHRGLALAAREALEQLTDDDSRRVSTAAAKALAADGGAPLGGRPEIYEKPPGGIAESLTESWNLAQPPVAVDKAPLDEPRHEEPPREQKTEPEVPSSVASVPDLARQAAAQRLVDLLVQRTSRQEIPPPVPEPPKAPPRKRPEPSPPSFRRSTTSREERQRVALDNVQVVRGHSKQVNCVAFSPDGSILASASGGYGGQEWVWLFGGDNTVYLRRVSDRKRIRELKGHTDKVTSVAFSPDGATIASGSADYSIKIWRVSNGAQLRELKGQTGHVYSVAFSPDGSMLASADNLSVKLWRVSDGQHLRTLGGHSGPVHSVAFSPNGKVIASGSGDQTVRLWGASDGRVLHTLGGHSGAVNSVAFSPNGETVASGSDDQTLRLWRSSDGQPIRTLKGHASSVYAVAFSPSGALLASGSGFGDDESGDRTVRMWQVSDGKLLLTLEGHAKAVYSVAFSPDAKIVASGSDDQTVRLWRINLQEST